MAGTATGELRHRVVIEEPVITQDNTTGEQLVTWTSVAEVWASIVPMSGREFLAAAAEQSEVRGRITIRYRDGIAANMRAVHRGKYYAILAVLPDNDSGIEHLTLMTGEGVRLEQ